jgi:hypothetical protein
MLFRAQSADILKTGYINETMVKAKEPLVFVP